jgi:predicted permease
MVLQLFSVIAPIFAIAAIGFLWARTGARFEAQTATTLASTIGLPCLLIDRFTGLTIEPAALFQVAAAGLLCVAFAAAGAYTLVRIAGLDARTFAPPLVFANWGNLGLPLSFFAFGDAGLSLALAFMATVTLVQMSLGVAMVSGDWSARSFARSPMLWSLSGAMLFVASDLVLPAWLQTTVHQLAGLTIPVMLIALGVSLAGLQRAHFSRAVLLGAVRLLLGMVVGASAALLLGLEGLAFAVVVLQASMPVAVFNYLFALRYERSPAEVAGMVLTSTLLSLITIPLLLSWLMPRVAG